ncbi:MAG: tRNA (adenosine(37)-N6)-threonylcarbamoyltransferase complex ATPase subunit type 1 TsaE [Gammaproteobacteria bacterium]|nr:tRNA (adenosine(37)-N6)-threonylcarbamoyltransferase complex ATPase subunit type 1 TsaE [Gammaproteobacteria bacterium]
MRAMTLELPDADATAALGAALARTFPGASESCVVVYLRGDLGAGKTACVRAWLEALGVARPIRSPTYTLVETYECGATTFLHVDLYRLNSGADLADLGLRDYFRPGHAILVEWPERAGDSLPAADLTVEMDFAPRGRRVRLSSAGERGDAWLSMLVSDDRITSYLFNLT